MDLFVGTSGYNYKEWKGPFYPEKMPAKDMLEFYSGQFRSVEINNSFYRVPKPDVVRNWAETVSSRSNNASQVPRTGGICVCVAANMGSRR